MLTFQEYLLEMPQVYHSKVSYQKASRFNEISLRNAHSYILLGVYENLVYLLSPSGNAGFVFTQKDMESSAQHIVPVMNLRLEDSGIDNLKQVHGLRIREEFASQNIATRFYKFYVEREGGIVSDTEHLEGGYLLWKSFLRKSKTEGLKVSLYNIEEKKEYPVGDSSEEDIWKGDKTGRNIVLILRK